MSYEEILKKHFHKMFIGFMVVVIVLLVMTYQYSREVAADPCSVCEEKNPTITCSGIDYMQFAKPGLGPENIVDNQEAQK